MEQRDFLIKIIIAYSSLYYIQLLGQQLSIDDKIFCCFRRKSTKWLHKDSKLIIYDVI